MHETRAVRGGDVFVGDDAHGAAVSGEPVPHRFVLYSSEFQASLVANDVVLAEQRLEGEVAGLGENQAIALFAGVVVLEQFADDIDDFRMDGDGEDSTAASRASSSKR